MKTAKEILYAKCRERNDGFLSGQVAWIVEAMEEYAALKIACLEKKPKNDERGEQGETDDRAGA